VIIKLGPDKAPLDPKLPSRTTAHHAEDAERSRIPIAMQKRETDFAAEIGGTSRIQIVEHGSTAIINSWLIRNNSGQ
jgi:hypothetical protein